jgi:hypothetical protein
MLLQFADVAVHGTCHVLGVNKNEGTFRRETTGYDITQIFTSYVFIFFESHLGAIFRVTNIRCFLAIIAIMAAILI